MRDIFEKTLIAALYALDHPSEPTEHDRKAAEELQAVASRVHDQIEADYQKAKAEGRIRQLPRIAKAGK